MPPTIPEYIFNYFTGNITNNYGPTETCISSTTYLPKPGLHLRNIPIGVPHANTQIYILDSELEPVPIGVAGEIYIGGDSLARGYLNQPALTAEKFIPHPFSRSGARLYRTGDLGRFMVDGNIEFLGRVDNQVKLRGNRIELGEIENALAFHPQIQLAVVLLEHAKIEDHLVAYIVPAADCRLDGKQLQAYLRNQLPDYMLPSKFIFLESLPRTSTGKVDLNALPGSEINRSNDSDNYVAPRTPLEQILIWLFSKALEKEKVSVQADFFELGGHSLLVMRLIAQINDLLKINLSMVSMFNYRTAEHLAAYILQNESERDRIERLAKSVIELVVLPD